jgi:hypothetical protein
VVECLPSKYEALSSNQSIGNTHTHTHAHTRVIVGTLDCLCFSYVKHIHEASREVRELSPDRPLLYEVPSPSLSGRSQQWLATDHSSILQMSYPPSHRAPDPGPSVLHPDVPRGGHHQSPTSCSDAHRQPLGPQ